jgi:putative transposase
MGRRGYPPEFRRKVLDLVEAGRPIAEVAKALGISAQSSSTWRRQDRIDKGLLPGLNSHEHDELVAARRRMLSLRPSWRSLAAPSSCSRSKRPLSTVRGHPGDGRPGAARPGLLLGAGGLAVWLLRLAQPAAIAASDPPCPAHRRDPTGPYRLRQTYGSRRVHAELTLGRGITVGFHAVELLMRRAGLQGVTGRPKFRRGLRPEATAEDLVKRQFTRTGPDQLWVTDITEQPTHEGKLYCAVVLDTGSRRVVAWSIDATPTAALVTNALGMAIQSRKPTAGDADPFRSGSSQVHQPGVRQQAAGAGGSAGRWGRWATASTMP